MVPFIEEQRATMFHNSPIPWFGIYPCAGLQQYLSLWASAFLLAISLRFDKKLIIYVFGLKWSYDLSHETQFFKISWLILQYFMKVSYLSDEGINTSQLFTCYGGSWSMVDMPPNEEHLLLRDMYDVCISGCAHSPDTINLSRTLSLLRSFLNAF